MYIMYMALHITNPAIEQAVRELAGLTGESITDAIGIAVSDRLQHLKPPRSRQSQPSVEEILALIRSYDLQPINQDLTDDEILGFGTDGVPE